MNLFERIRKIRKAITTAVIVGVAFLFLTLCAPPAHAQSYQLFTNVVAANGSFTSPILIPGSFTTNIPTSLSRSFRAGPNGIGFFFRSAGTNAATTTNSTVTFEISDDNVNWIDNVNPVVSAPQNGTSGYDYHTNIITGTSANLGNAVFWRIKTIQNTNLASIWISNAVANPR